MTKKQRIIDKINSQISSCADCESWSDGEPVWLWGNESDVYDLLFDLGIDSDCFSEYQGEIFCSNCKSELEIASKVGIKTKYQKDLEFYIDKCTKKYNNKLKDFDIYIKEFPLLALNHPVGRKIYQEIQQMNLPKVDLNIGDILFRSRLVNDKKILTSEQMKNAPLGKPSEGRFNHNGQSHFYLSNKKETAIAEVENNVLVWVQQFEITNKIENILDLKYSYNEISLSTNSLLVSLHLTDVLCQETIGEDNWKPQYNITRFIMDCARELGYQGIRYNSVKLPSGINYVLFYPEKISLLEKGEPRVEMSKSNTTKRLFNLLADE